MNKRELVAAVAECVGSEEVAADAVEAVLNAITAAVAAGDEVDLSEFGVFGRALRAPSRTRDILTRRRVEIPGTYLPRFEAAPAFRKAVAADPSVPT